MSFENWAKFVTETTERIKGSKHNPGSSDAVGRKEGLNEKISYRRTAHRAHGKETRR